MEGWRDLSLAATDQSASHHHAEGSACEVHVDRYEQRSAMNRFGERPRKPWNGPRKRSGMY